MYNFKANEDILPLSEFRSNLAGYITQTRETGRPIIVTQNGRTAGVFVNASTWDEIQEKLEKMEAYEGARPTAARSFRLRTSRRKSSHAVPRKTARPNRKPANFAPQYETRHHKARPEAHCV